MTLIINNSDVHEVLSMAETMAETMAALERSYADLLASWAVCRPRIDIQLLTRSPGKTYQWGTMEGSATRGYFAIRMKSDVITQENRNGIPTEEKYCMRPGRWCGLILLTSIENAEPLAIMNDGVLQHMRVGADGGIGVKYVAHKDAAVVGMLGSGGMARSHMAAFMEVRKNRKVQVFSPTRANREAFAQEMHETYGIEAIACDAPEKVYRGADILAALTDATEPVTDGALVEPGTHVVVIGGSGAPDDATISKIDLSLRFGDAPQPWGLPEFGKGRSRLTYAAMTETVAEKRMTPDGRRGGRKAVAEARVVWLADILAGRSSGRTSDEQITYSGRGNLQGAQFYAVAGRAYELARAAGKGREIPTDWFLRDIRD
jgi:ornithine cyclodeaminase/alanine dehydrogenase-like protein (mu-crystallin family)